MSKVTEYYLIARNEKTNTFKIVPINNQRSSILEDIDLFTMKFRNNKELTAFLTNKEILEPSEYDFFIVTQKKVDGKNELLKQELVYSNSKVLKDIAKNSKEKAIIKSGGNIDSILDSFAYFMQQEGDFWKQVVTGKTNIYPKFADYFISGRNVNYTSVKYRDGGWARKSYPLIRNILEAKSRNKEDYDTIERDMYRSLIDERLFDETKPIYAENQISMFDIISEEKEKEDKLLEVIHYFENLPRDIFIIKEEEAKFNDRLFPSYEGNDIDIFRFNLPERLQYTLQLLAVNKETYNNVEYNKDSFQVPIKQNLNAIIRILKSSKETLDKAYEWCLLYDKYKEKALGDVHGREYQKEC